MPPQSSFGSNNDIPLLLRFIESVLVSLRNAQPKHIDLIPLENVFRYLEQYRYDAFDWRDAHGRESEFARKARKHGESVAKRSINQAAKIVFPGQTREWVALTMQHTLRTFLAGKPVDLYYAKRFFAQLQSELGNCR